MLAEELLSTEGLDKNRTYIIQQKIDGVRAVAYLIKGAVRIIGRHSTTDISYRYPEVVADLRKMAESIPEGMELIFDGELCCLLSENSDSFWLNVSFPSIASREHTEGTRKIELLSKMLPATFVIFDILGDNKDLPLSDRLKVLDSVNMDIRSKELKRIRVIKTIAGNYQNAEKLFEKARQLELEGIMLKLPLAPYQGRRSPAWLKLKTYRSTEEKIIGYTSKNRAISALILESGSKVNAVISTPDEELILKEEIAIEKSVGDEKQFYFSKSYLIAEVKYLERTEEGKLRFPVLKEIRNTT